jgi:hypothetical protein
MTPEQHRVEQLARICAIARRLTRGHHSEKYGDHYYAIDCDACHVVTLARQILNIAGTITCEHRNRISGTTVGDPVICRDCGEILLHARG